MLYIRERWRGTVDGRADGPCRRSRRHSGVLVGVDPTNCRDIVDQGCHAGGAPSVLGQ